MLYLLAIFSCDHIPRWSCLPSCQKGQKKRGFCNNLQLFIIHNLQQCAVIVLCVDAQIIEVLVTANLEIIKMLDWFGDVLCCMFNGCSWGTAWGTCICAWPFAYPVWPAGGCSCLCMCSAPVPTCYAVLLLGSVVMAPCILQPLSHLLLFELLFLQLNFHPPYFDFLLY